MRNLHIPVFRGITEAEFEEMKAASCLRERHYLKNEFVFRMGDETAELGIVLSGSVIVENTDVWGNTSVLAKVAPGGVFAETYALGRMPMMVEALAQEDCKVLFFNLAALDADGPSDSPWRRKMTKNLLDISARKNITLSERMFCISPKTVRGRVLAFLSKEARSADSDTFVIPFDRQQMADYLNVDRTALSKELGRMKEEGLIDFHKDRFTIHGAEINSQA